MNSPLIVREEFQAAWEQNIVRSPKVGVGRLSSSRENRARDPQLGN